MDLKLDGLTLANVAEGKLEESFQECLAEAMEVIGSAEAYVAGKGDLVKSKIICEIEISHRIADDGTAGTTILDASCQIKRPKRRGRGQALWTRSGAFLVEEHEARQDHLFKPTQPLSIRGADSQ